MRKRRSFDWLVAKTMRAVHRVRGAVTGLTGDRAGVSAVMTAAMLPMLIGVVGLAVDAGVWQMNKRSLQGAVDQAAYSAAIASVNDATNSQAIAEGKAVMASMGLLDGAKGVSITISNPPTQGSYASNADAWEASATRTQKLFFAGLFLPNAPTIAARAVALKGAKKGSGCILTLDTSAAGASTFTNNADVTDENCDVYTNSSNAKALQCDNNCDIFSDTYTVGGTYVTNNGSLSGKENKTGVSPTPDPYADITAPASSSLACTSNTSVTSSGTGTTVTINPGVYCGGINFTGNKTLVMNPGTYYIKTKFNLANNAILQATGGVTIVLLDDLCMGDGSCKKEKGIGNHVTINLVAPTTGPYAGIAIFASGSGKYNKTQEFSNNAALNIQGALYAPYHTFTFHNNAQFSNMLCAQVVSLRVMFENNADMGTDCGSAGVRDIGGGYAPTTMVE